MKTEQVTSLIHDMQNEKKTILNNNSSTIYSKMYKPIKLQLDTKSVFREPIPTCRHFNQYKEKTYRNIKLWDVETSFFFQKLISVLDNKMQEFHYNFIFMQIVFHGHV